MSAGRYLADATTRNAVFTQRLAAGEAKKANQFLDELRLNINGVMSTGDFTPARQEQVLLEVDRLNTEYLDEMGLQIAQTVRDTGQYTAGFTKRLLDKASTVTFVLPSDDDVAIKVLTASMDVQPGGKSITIQDAIDQYKIAKSGEITRVINDGIVSGLTKDQIIENINKAIQIAKRQGETLVRTVTNSSANIGRLSTLIEAQQYLEGYEWVSKLDIRTTLTCAGLDGKVYEFGTGNPLPPAHWGCRSQIVAALLPKYQAPGLKGEKNAEGGKVSANTTYGPWLKKQPTSFVNEALGPERASLFLQGELKIDRFTDTTGKAYTIQQLRQLEPMAFERAGLSL